MEKEDFSKNIEKFAMETLKKDLEHVLSIIDSDLKNLEKPNLDSSDIKTYKDYLKLRREIHTPVHVWDRTPP